MNKAEIVEYLAKTKYIENFINKIGKGESQFNIDDLCQDIYCDLLNKPEEKIVELWNNEELDYFCYRIICNQIFSKTSPYFKQYKNIIYVDDEKNKTSSDC